MPEALKSWWPWITIVVLAGAVAAWQILGWSAPPAGIASANGRIEAVEIDIAARTAGRVEAIRVDEGDFVRAGEELARMDTAVLQAQRREAEAALARARIAVETATSQVTQREAEAEAARALIAQREAELDAAQKRLVRTRELAAKNAVSEAQLDDDRAAAEAARAAVAAARAQAAAAQAAIGQARSNVVASKAAVDAARATLERIQADLDDSVLVAPRDGRVQYRVAQPGEVLSPGGVVLNMVDLTDVYMTFFLPTEQAGRVALGAEAHLVLDAAPQYVIPAEVSFVADVAQFTPKTVETAEERQKLMFRIKARIDPDLLRKYLHQVKTGLPGMAHVRLDPQVEWPPELQVRLPQ
ncbi:MAG: HlyD family efflux transporter periplasmic adaptor subunit [Gammaproteobacteria bacterium]|nr:HlyD family efflux transporter periplasmic adaptor subunit [Gammaproteobacteria bacterium]MDX5503243.1 HlyD family efflux transporter periplasmic adaptor subunit [Halomonas sp.]